ARNAALHRRMSEPSANLPDRGGSPSPAHRFNQLSKRFPPPALWLLLGLIGLVWRRSRAELALPAPTVAGALVIVLSPAALLRAAGRVIHGASPYAFHADQTYAYPPVLAFLAAPLHPLAAGVATLLWTLLSLAAIGGALWLLGLRDWRCFALAAVFPFTRSAV